MRYGFNHHLEISDLYTHPSEADSEKLHRMFSKYISVCDALFIGLIHKCSCVYTGIGDRNYIEGPEGELRGYGWL